MTTPPVRVIVIVVTIQNNGFCVYKVQWKSDRDFSRRCSAALTIQGFIFSSSLQGVKLISVQRREGTEAGGSRLASAQKIQI